MIALATHAAALTPAKPWPRTPHRGVARLRRRRRRTRKGPAFPSATITSRNMLSLDRAGDFLEAIAALEPERVGSDAFGNNPFDGGDWDLGIWVSTYTDYRTPHGPFTVHSYHEESDSGTRIYATDAASGKELMGRIVEAMRPPALPGYGFAADDTMEMVLEDVEKLNKAARNALGE